jgi:ABC-2 type transport system permease protein
MKKISLILRHEIITLLSRPAYLLFAFGIPLLSVLIFGLISITRKDTDLGVSTPEEETELQVEGYVDYSGLIQILPEDLPSNILLPYSDESQAAEALESGEIAGYYIVPENIIEEGDLIFVHPARNIFSSGGQDWVMQWTLLVNLLGGDMESAQRIWNPMDLQVTNLTPQPKTDRFTEEDCTSPGYACQSNAFVTMIPFYIVILFFVFISTSSGQLLTNITKEKQNRMMEVLMLSINPREMLAGKITGLGIVSLLQVATWAVSMLVVLRLGGNTLSLPEGFSIPTSVLIWWILFFLLGYAIYASLMGGIGALVPDIKVGNQASWLVLLPLMIGYFFAVTPLGQEDPNGWLSTLLSIFPLTSPILMIMRVTIGEVPLWQLILAIVLAFLTIIFVIRSVARIFRAQTILSGQSFSTRRYFQVLVGRE